MPSKHIPVYNIDSFGAIKDEKDFYANTLANHLSSHHFIHEPHKHDFYITVLFTKGKGVHEIDFLSYDVKPGSVFFLSPGQMHNWKLSDNTDGYIFFHSEAFYNLAFASKTIRDLPFFNSVYNTPQIALKLSEKNRLQPLFEELLKEYRAHEHMKHARLCSLTDLIYIDLARLYAPGYDNKETNPGYLDKLRKLEGMIDREFKTLKFPADYASRMNMSEKHLNRICRACLDKTVTEVISDRVILEAKRLLITSKRSVSEVSEFLGYPDHAYFSRLFKKKCGKTPLEFAKQYKKL